MIEILLLSYLLLGCDSHLGSKEQSVYINTFDNDIREEIGVELDSSETVYKLEIIIKGQLNDDVVFNNKDLKAGEIDTAFIKEWYYKRDSLIVVPGKLTKGELEVSYKFYFTKG